MCSSFLLPFFFKVIMNITIRTGIRNTYYNAFISNVRWIHMDMIWRVYIQKKNLFLLFPFSSLSLHIFALKFIYVAEIWYIVVAFESALSLIATYACIGLLPVRITTIRTNTNVLEPTLTIREMNNNKSYELRRRTETGSTPLVNTPMDYSVFCFTLSCDGGGSSNGRCL